LNKRLRERDPSPPWQWVFILAFTGVRGAVSLAAALAIPFALPNGDGFPYRDLILLCSFGVIFITLVGLGLGLRGWRGGSGSPRPGAPNMSRKLEAEIAGPARGARCGAGVARRHHPTIAELSDEVVKLLRARHETRINQLPDSLDPQADDVSAAGIDLTRELDRLGTKFIHVLCATGKITDETRRHIERDLDLEEASLANREYRRTPL